MQTGKMEGIGKLYYESGNLRQEGNFKDDKQDGITKTYYPNGGIMYIDIYRNGQKINRKAYDRGR